MTLKAVVDDLNTVPSVIREFYTEKDGKFVLSVDGLVSKAKLDEFRANNITLAQERDALRQKFDGIDPDFARQLLHKAQAEKDKKMIDEGKVDELLAQRVEIMRTDYETKLNDESTKINKLQSQLESLLVDGAIRDVAARAGVRPTAIEDILLRGRNLFKLMDGKAVPMQGEDVMYGKTGEAMSMEEWLGTLATSAPHLFELNRGGGAPGGTAAFIAGGKYIEAGDTKGFLNNLADIARANARIS